MKAPLVMGKGFSGTGAEIGAGTGMYTAVLSRIPGVDKIYCIDYSKEDVEQLMPIVFERMGADLTKIVRVVGSFNAMQLDDRTLDFIICLGSLHHSEDLYRTAGECFRVLKPGGWLFASERARANTCHNAEIQAALISEYTQQEKERQFGIASEVKITRAMNSEHEPRLCEYEADFARAGFQVFAFTFVSPFTALALWPLKVLHCLFSSLLGDSLLKRRTCSVGYSKVPFYPWFAEGRLRKKVMKDVDPLLLICQKR